MLLEVIHLDIIFPKKNLGSINPKVSRFNEPSCRLGQDRIFRPCLLVSLPFISSTDDAHVFVRKGGGELTAARTAIAMERDPMGVVSNSLKERKKLLKLDF